MFSTLSGTLYQGKIYLSDPTNTNPEMYDLSSKVWTRGLTTPNYPRKVDFDIIIILFNRQTLPL